MTPSPGHFIKKCKHGFVVSQCRCPGPKTEMIVACISQRCKTVEVTGNPVVRKQGSGSMDGSVLLDDGTVIEGRVDVRDAGWVRIEDARVRGNVSTLGQRMSIPTTRVLRVEWK